MRKTNKMQKRPRKSAKKGGRKTKKIQKHRKNRYKNKIRGGAQTVNIINTAFSPNADLEKEVKEVIPVLEGDSTQRLGGGKSGAFVSKFSKDGTDYILKIFPGRSYKNGSPDKTISDIFDSDLSNEDKKVSYENTLVGERASDGDKHTKTTYLRSLRDIVIHDFLNDKRTDDGKSFSPVFVDYGFIKLRANDFKRMLRSDGFVRANTGIFDKLRTKFSFVNEDIQEDINNKGNVKYINISKSLQDDIDYHPFYITEVVNGKELEKKIAEFKKTKSIQQDEAISIMLNLAKALKALHTSYEKKINVAVDEDAPLISIGCHRDLHVGNIFVDENNDVKLIDFDLSISDNNELITNFECKRDGGLIKGEKIAANVMSEGLNYFSTKSLIKDSKTIKNDADLFNYFIIFYYILNGYPEMRKQVEESVKQETSLIIQNNSKTIHDIKLAILHVLANDKTWSF